MKKSKEAKPKLIQEVTTEFVNNTYQYYDLSDEKTRSDYNAAYLACTVYGTYLASKFYIVDKETVDDFLKVTNITCKGSEFCKGADDALKTIKDASLK